jgi:hypothetical protein
MTTEQKIQELEKQIEKLKKEEEMEQWFKSLLNGLEIEINDKAPESVFYKKDGKVFFELIQKSEKRYFWCNYKLVWNILRDKYKFNYDETQAFIKSMVEQHLKLEAVTPKAMEGWIKLQVEQHLKLEKQYQIGAN